MAAADDIRRWCLAELRPGVRSVVVVGYGPEAWSIIHEYAPGLPLVVFLPGITPEQAEALKPPKNVLVVGSLPELRAASTDIPPWWEVPMMGDPAIRDTIGQLASQAVFDGREFSSVMQFTMRSLAKQWTELSCALMPEYAGKVTLSDIHGALSRVPAVIVGAGPSLQKNIADLKRLQDRCIIIATNSALGPLHDAGIQAHMVVVVDAEWKFTRLSLNVPELANMVLAPGGHTPPRMWRLPVASVLPIMQATGPVAPFLCGVTGRQPTDGGGSVSTLAHMVAEKLGCDPIVLIGCDCALSADGQAFYADGVRHAHLPGFQRPDTNIRPVVAWGGVGEVEGHQTLDAFRIWFEARTKRAQAKLINATEGGARIAGWDEMRLVSVGSGWRRIPDPVATIKAAQAKALPIDGAQLCAAIKLELRDLDEFERISGETKNALIDAYAGITTLSEIPGNRNHIIRAYAIGSVEETAAVPKQYQWSAMIEALTRTHGRCQQLRVRLQRAINRLERMNHARAA